MDKWWMSKNRLSNDYEDGVESFLKFAIENGKDPNAMWHWILIVIDPHIETLYVLDLLNNQTHLEQLKDVVDMAIKSFNLSKGKRGRKNILWEKIKCPQQPDGKQCGFYVMRYMKDIIENCGSVDSIPLSSLVFSEGYYSKTKIDEVRTECLNLCMILRIDKVIDDVLLHHFC